MSDAAAIAHAGARPPLLGPFGRKAIRLGRFLDIEIGLDFSWLFIFALVTVSLSGQFGAEHGDWSSATAWSAGVLASLIFFLSILLHELGHSVTSNALGLPVKSITLFIFGGLARLSGKPRTPREEFLIGIAGPAVSVALGVLFLGVAFALPSETFAGEFASAIFSWLGQINLMLAVFNMFPGHPLDGGHILRAAVWAWTGKEHLATRVASAMGSTFALFLIGFGAVSILALGNIGGFWLVLIGWFLMRASQGSVLQEVLEYRLGRVRAREAMAERCPRVPAHMTVDELISGAILRRGERHFCVEENGALQGLITLNQVKSVPVLERAETPVAAIMIPRARLGTIDGDETLWIAMKRMDDMGVNQLPVMSGEHLIGILSREQLLRVVRNQLDLGGNS